MCLSTVYIEKNGHKTKVAEDISRMDAGDGGYVFTTLFGDETFVPGCLIQIDFMETNTILLKSS